MQGGSQVFHSFALPSTIIAYHLFHIFYRSFHLINWPPMCAEGLTHHPHYHHSILIQFCHICLCFAQQFTIIFKAWWIICFKAIRFMKLLSHQQWSSLCPWCCPTVSVRLPTCVSMGNSGMKFEWALLTAPICKSRCGARTISHVHPHTGAQVA
jgi:hypothetical protein